MTPITDSFVENSQVNNFKDPRWLQVEVCREFQRGKCTRAETECRFAHPDENVQVENGGRVTACFDSMKVSLNVLKFFACVFRICTFLSSWKLLSQILTIL